MSNNDDDDGNMNNKNDDDDVDNGDNDKKPNIDLKPKSIVDLWMPDDVVHGAGMGGWKTI